MANKPLAETQKLNLPFRGSYGFLGVVAGTAEAAFATDRKRRIIAWNKAAERLLGYEERQVLDKRCYQVLCGTDIFGNRYCDTTCILFNMARRHEAVRHFKLDVRKGNSEIIRADVSVIFVPGQTPSKFAIIHLLRPVEREEEAENPRHPTSVARTASGLAPLATQAFAPLSVRESEVFRLLVDGKSTKDIANIFFISVTTVRNHIKHILRKLKVHSRLEVVSAAHRNRLI